MAKTKLRSLELCAGGGGIALGLEQAGFQHEGLIDIDDGCCATLSHNRPKWNVSQRKLEDVKGSEYGDIDLLSGGLPCPPFSVAGKQMGEMDERNCFPHAIRLVKEIQPKAVMFENVRGLLMNRFQEYRKYIDNVLLKMDYLTDWRVVNAADFDVPQIRHRVICIAIKRHSSDSFRWPQSARHLKSTQSVGSVLFDLMSQNNWKGVSKWKELANQLAPTIVGGSKKHGGPDLGPTRTKQAWVSLGVDGKGIANNPPDEKFSGMPRLTLRMVARLQGFSDDWEFVGSKTSAYRQIGNALPPPVAKAIGCSIIKCLTNKTMKSLEVVIKN